MKLNPSIRRNVSRGILAFFAVALLAGCASVSVTDIEQYRKRAPRQKPRIIYVERFSAPNEILRVDRKGKELAKFKSDLQTLVAEGTAERLSKHVAPAKALSRGAGEPSSGWLVRGRFIRVNQGSRALRVVFGLGAGGTKMETEVEVYDLSRMNAGPFLKFRTTGGSNAEPGAVFGAIGTGPIDIGVGVAVVAASVVNHGVTEDAERTAREITAQLSEYSQDRRWISKDKGLRSKKLDADKKDAPAKKK